MRWTIAILIVLLGWLQYRLWVGDGSLAEVATLRREIAAQEEEIQRLQVRNRILEAEVQDLRAGEDALEERARSELGMIKQGEIFLQVVEPGADPQPAAGSIDHE
jgi:cell division protein FtsB